MKEKNVSSHEMGTILFGEQRKKYKISLRKYTIKMKKYEMSSEVLVQINEKSHEQ